MVQRIKDYWHGGSVRVPVTVGLIVAALFAGGILQAFNC